MLQADELLVVLGQAVGELLPPALLRRILGQPEQEFPVRSGDLVVVEQPLDLPGAQAGPGPLVPADLRRRPLQRRGDRVSALAFVFPDPAQLGGQSAPPYRGASRRDHRAFLLLGAARADQCDGHADFSETCALILLVPIHSPIVTMTWPRLPAGPGVQNRAFQRSRLSLSRGGLPPHHGSHGSRETHEHHRAGLPGFARTATMSHRGGYNRDDVTSLRLRGPSRGCCCCGSVGCDDRVQ